MSFGVSVSDMIMVLSVAKKAYQGWSTACGEYSDITCSLQELVVLLQRIREQALLPKSALVRSTADAKDLATILSGCQNTTDDFIQMIVQFRRLGYSKSRRRNWERLLQHFDRLRFSNPSISSLRMRLCQHTSVLGAFLSAVELGTLAEIRHDVSRMYIAMCQSSSGRNTRGSTRDSVLTTHDDDDKEVRRHFRRELISDGIKSSTIHQHKVQIRQNLRCLAGQGLLEEQPPSSESCADISGRIGLDVNAWLDGNSQFEAERTQHVRLTELSQMKDRAQNEEHTGADKTSEIRHQLQTNRRHQGGDVKQCRKQLDLSELGVCKQVPEDAEVIVHLEPSSHAEPEDMIADFQVWWRHPSRSESEDKIRDFSTYYRHPLHEIQHGPKGQSTPAEQRSFIAVRDNVQQLRRQLQARKQAKLDSEASRLIGQLETDMPEAETGETETTETEEREDFTLPPEPKSSDETRIDEDYRKWFLGRLRSAVEMGNEYKAVYGSNGLWASRTEEDELMFQGFLERWRSLQKRE